MSAKVKVIDATLMVNVRRSSHHAGEGGLVKGHHSPLMLTTARN